MEGDLSLSQSFGGLRIANPDDIRPSSSPEQIKTPAAPPRPSSVDSSRAGNEPEPQSTSEAFPQLLGDSCEDTNGSLSFDPSSYNSTSDPSASNIPPVAAAQERVPYADLPRQAPNSDAQPQGSYPLQRRAHSGSNASTRPSSTIFNQMLSHPAPGAPREGTYRLRSESSRSSMSGVPSRSDSRSAHTALQAGVPMREASHRDRAYRQQGPGPNGGLPPRRSSRGMAQANGAYPSGSTPPTAPTYMAEGAPLPSSEEWKEKGASVVKREEIDEQGRPVTRYMKKGVKDFNFGRTLGEGSYSTVLAATDRQTLREYAIKVLDKRHIIKEKKVKYVNIEKDTLNRLTEHPGIVRLYYTFQDERSLYFVLDLASNGELLGVLKRMGTFDEECTRFYGAQILDAIEYMHSKGVIHRDLKPENVLLNDQMHVKITDFGTAKILNVPRMPEGGVGGYPSAGDPLDGVDSGKANSFVGTAEYVSPELLTDKSACKASDLWAFGCIVYQLLAGRPPFKAANEYQTFQKIVALDYEFPRGFPEVAKDLVERLLILDPAKRLSMEHIKNHEFFDGITWGRGLWKQKAPRLRSYVPPPQETIKLNGNGMSSVPPPISRAPSSALPGTASRPQPRIITELPPPSQLDIEWSPVLTRSNERILKLGNMIVLSQPTPHSPNSKNGSADSVETPKKFSRFFGGGGSKKRQRLVMITSSARIILAAAGGDEKKTKTEISLLAPGTTWKSSTDGKGLTTWSVETKDKMFIFEDPKPSGDATGKGSTIEWLDTIDRAKELAFAQSMNDPYSSDDTFKNTALPDSQNADDPPLRFDASGNNSRNTLTKNNQGFPDQDPAKVATGRKRFSRRQSRSGLAAVF